MHEKTGKVFCRHAARKEVRIFRMSEMFLHKCPNCNATLEFNIESGMVVCAYCGSRYNVKDLLTEAGQAASSAADAAGAPAESAKKADKIKEFDWGKYKERLTREELAGNRSYLCETCGAEVILGATVASAKCPYCDNNLILLDNVTASLRPNAIIPFKILPDQLSDSVKKFYKNRKLLPFHFFDQNKMSAVRGLYVPFWLYNCHLKGQMTLKGSTSRSYISGDYRITETSNYDLLRDAQMGFERIPVDASLKMPDELMDSLEPFDYSDLTEFNSGYLTGFISERFDSDPDENLPRVTERVNNSLLEIMKGTCTQYSNVSVSENHMNVDESSVKYVMLPIYLFDCMYAGKTYHYAANGQTGKVIGELPVSKGKKWLYFGIPFLILFAIAAFILRWFMG